jgi:hypothetical protein
MNKGNKDRQIMQLCSRLELFPLKAAMLNIHSRVVVRVHTSQFPICLTS